MKCENLQPNLSLYADNDLSDEERKALERHLPTCPVCRSKYAELVSLRNEFRSLARLQMPADLMYSVRNAVAAELNQTVTTEKSLFSNNFREWLQYRLMPYGVGTLASLVLVVLFLSALVSTKEMAYQAGEIAKASSPSLVMTNTNSEPFYSDPLYRDLALTLTEKDVADLRIPVSSESPSLNPQGALVALTRSVARGKIRDEEVVVVADVFSNGLAQIAEVVEAPRSRQSLADLEKALRDDPTYAPFVPAKLDNRSNDMRVVLKIVRVDVVDRER